MQRFHGEKELFDSDHTDEVHKGTVIGKAFVHSLKKYEVIKLSNEEGLIETYDILCLKVSLQSLEINNLNLTLLPHSGSFSDYRE